VGKKGFVGWHVVQDILTAESPRVEKNATPGLTQGEATEFLKVVGRHRPARSGSPIGCSRPETTPCSSCSSGSRGRVSAILCACVGRFECSDAD
jgi:hypothetical protein